MCVLEAKGGEQKVTKGEGFDTVHLILLVKEWERSWFGIWLNWHEKLSNGGGPSSMQLQQRVPTSHVQRFHCSQTQRAPHLFDS